jgi:hypothetical protein
MRLVDRLRLLAEAFESIRPVIDEAATRLEDQRQWRHMWLDAEKRVEELTSELNKVRSQLSNRK